MSKKNKGKVNSPVVQTEKQKNYLLKYVWDQYELWDATANELKEKISKWEKRVLWFIILGAVLGTFSAFADSQSKSTDIPFLNKIFSFLSDYYFQHILAITSTFFIGFASFAGGRILTQEEENLKLNTRAAAETFKSEAYRYIFSSPPYNENRDLELTIFISNMNKKMSEIEYEVTSEEKLNENEWREIFPDESTFKIEDYIKKRVEGQVKWYLNKSKTFQGKIKKYKTRTFILGALGVVLGTLASSGITELSVFIAMITSVTASMSGYFASHKYQSLVISYQATADRLKLNIAKWERNNKINDASDSAFVEKNEDILSLEHSAWVAKLSKKEKKEEKF